MYEFVEVCSGAGGLSTGLARAGLRPVLLNDIDPTCCETLRRNHDCAVVCGPLQQAVGVVRGRPPDRRVALLAAGLPCQSFSTAGKREGMQDARGQVFLDFVEAVRAIEPRMYLIENVKGIINHSGGETFRFLQQQLSLGGTYRIYHSVLNAAAFGVPQKRERVFIVGVHHDIDAPFEFPAGGSEVVPVRHALDTPGTSQGVQYSEYKRAFFRLIPPGGCWVDLPAAMQKDYMGASFHASGGRRGILRRLHMDRPAPTLLCNPQSKQSERCHPTEDRPLNLREYARIQTFDDDYAFAGSVAQRYRQIGNAVPVLLAYRGGVRIVEFLERHARSAPALVEA